MSREIDLSEPLSDEDRKYLEERADYHRLSENKRMTEGEDPFSYEGQGPGVDDTGLRANTGDMGAPDPERVDPGVIQASDGDPGESTVEKAYEDQTNQELRNEIRRRNEDRDPEDRLPVSGDKAALVATLKKDDEGDSDDDES